MRLTEDDRAMIDTELLGLWPSGYYVLPGCPVPLGGVLRAIMDVHVAGLGPDWRRREPLAQRVEVDDRVLLIVTVSDTRTGLRMTTAMSEAEYLEWFEE